MDWHTENNSHRINHILSIIILLFPHSHYLHIMKMQKYLTILNTRWQIDRLNFIHRSRYLVSSIHTISHPLHITSGHWTHTLPGGTGVMNDGIPGVPCSCPRNSEHLHGIFYYYDHKVQKLFTNKKLFTSSVRFHWRFDSFTSICWTTFLWSQKTQHWSQLLKVRIVNNNKSIGPSDLSVGPHGLLGFIRS